MLGTSALTGFACSCIDPGLSGHFVSAANVFEAVAIGSRIVDTGDAEDPKMREFTLLVRKVYKGCVAKKVVVRTRLSGAACGIYLPLGGRYLVFTGAGDDGSDRSLYSSLCMGNRYYPFWRFSLRKNVRRLFQGDSIPKTSKWAKAPSW
ncbi:MAG: hypothetical protein KA352_14390 [Flavobacteriales bacterium]|nr:hypothetical protein [Flavobacteriales bacterium]